MKDIEGYEGRYAITSCGKVWSYKNQRFLKLHKHHNGYLSIILEKPKKEGGERKTYMIHRLVAQAYIDNPNNYPEVNHKDETRDNNCVNNLEWCTRQYNNTYGTIRKRIAISQGKKIICAETGEVFYAIREAARKTGISQPLIAGCCNFKYKQAKGFHFYYYDYFIKNKEKLKRELKKIYIFCIETNKYYKNSAEAANDIGCSRNSVTSVCAGHRGRVYGHTLIYVEKGVIK